MHVAFYAPMKPASHPVPSGDRQMVRLLMRALEAAGFVPETASELRVYLKTGDGELSSLRDAAHAEVLRLVDGYRTGALNAPAVWFTYHPYYKSPDLIGPSVSGALDIPYVTAEASWSSRRAGGDWARSHELNAEGLRSARMHLCFTARDRKGLEELLDGDATLADFPPFTDVSQIAADGTETRSTSEPVRLLTVAMMRRDVKLQSYRMLAEALTGMQDLDWHLDVVGDGEARGEVERAFSGIEGRRITMHGELPQDRLFELYRCGDLHVWPGFGEAFGMALLEAQAAGLPVIAQDTKGIPSVVEHGRTGLLTPENDVERFRAAIRRLIEDADLRAAMARDAEEFVRGERSLERASGRLRCLLGELS